MSLLRLLTAGKCLTNLKDVESPYRLTSQRLLPHFGATTNPFCSKGKAEPGPEAVSREAPATARSWPNVGAWIPVRGLWQRTAEPLGRWKGKLSELVARPSRKASKPAISRFSKPPVQGELSLDRVKVVRNDLSDADLEVIPARSKLASAAPAAEKASNPEETWGQAITQLLPAGKL